MTGGPGTRRAAADLGAAAGREVPAYQVDTGDDASVRQLVTDVRDRLGGIGILVNCAARPAGQARSLIDASQVAAVITFLASPLAVSVNGESIACGGGTPGVIRY